jgi:transposase-like protein
MENLNIQENHKMLAIKALNQSKKLKDAAKLIGIHPKTLTYWIRLYNINIKNTNG